MSMMTRFIRLWKADLHGVMDEIEDRRLLLNQHIREMEAALQEKEARVRALSREKERLSGEILRQTAAVNGLEEDITAAVQQERDDIARFLIRKHRIAAGHLEALERRHEAVKQDMNRETDSLAENRRRYEEIRLQAEAFDRREPSDDPPSGFAEPADRWGISDEEIEIDLLRRKERAAERRTS